MSQEEKDVVGEEAAKYEASLIRDGVMDDETCFVVASEDYDELRQQLADVSHERDLLRELLVRVIDSGALSNERFEDIESEACSIVNLLNKPSAEVKS